MISSATIEGIIDKIQILSIVPGPQKPYVQLLTGEAGFVGSLGDLISKYSQHEATKNDYLDVVQDIVSVVGATAFIVSGTGFVALSAGSIIGAINYLDRKNWNIDTIKNDIFNMIDDIFGKNNLEYNQKKYLANFLSSEQSENFLNSNINNKYKEQIYTDFTTTLKYFNEDGSVNFAKYLADTANISLYDPIALDLNANGKIDTLSLENGVFFDHNGDKVAFKSSWVNSSDGILARDIDGDGKITSGAELFGNFTKLKNGELAKNGKEALSDLDSDENGVFDERDEAFGQILVWQDENSDGISQKNELKTLNEHNIKSIDLEFMADNTALDKDNKQILIGSFSTNISNESKNNLASDIDFSVDTIQRNILDDTDGIIKGTGFVRNFNLSLNDEIKNTMKYKTLSKKQK